MNFNTNKNGPLDGVHDATGDRVSRGARGIAGRRLSKPPLNCPQKKDLLSPGKKMTSQKALLSF